MQFHQNIGIQENAFSDKECDELVEFFDQKEFIGEMLSMANRKSRKDIAIYPNNFESYNAKFEEMFQSRLRVFYQEYCKKFIVKGDNHPIFLPEEYYNNGYKIQKSETGGGFLSYHIENTLSENCLPRFLVWMVYLNDKEIVSGGKTDFPHQDISITPKKGTLVFFPAFFPYIHRASPDLVGIKYIMTGWFNKKPLKDLIDEHTTNAQ